MDYANVGGVHCSILSFFIASNSIYYYSLTRYERKRLKNFEVTHASNFIALTFVIESFD